MQSFPNDYEFAGTSRSQYQQIGNAVPPLLGSAIGKRIAAHLDGQHAPVPEAPAWRRTSANRRIGTHGWVIVEEGHRPRLKLNAKVRPDHVWSDETELENFDVIE